MSIRPLLVSFPETPGLFQTMCLIFHRWSSACYPCWPPAAILTGTRQETLGLSCTHFLVLSSSFSSVWSQTEGPGPFNHSFWCRWKPLIDATNESSSPVPEAPCHHSIWNTSYPMTGGGWNIPLSRDGSGPESSLGHTLGGGTALGRDHC